MENESITLSGLARRLVANGVLDEEKARATYLESVENGVSYISHLLTDKTLDGYGIAVAASQEFGVPLFNITTIELENEVVSLVSPELIQRHNVLPLYKRGGRLFVAVSDPTNLQALDEIKFHTGLNIEPVLAPHDILQVIIGKTLDSAEESLGDLDDDDLAELETEAEPDPGTQENEADVNDTPVVRFVNKIMLDAIKRGASDIHFEPYETSYRVRIRLDGILQEVAHPPVKLGNRLAARIKVMAQLDVSERRIPQDGRIKLKLSKKRAVDFRVSTCPTLFGEKVVMRVLDPMASHLGIDSLGFDEEQKELFNHAIRQPNGMVLVTGPTGSGKTTTLYACLNHINSPEKNILTVEDPIEYQLQGISQMQVNPKIDLTFSSGLRSYLRHDPDVIMVGEIRDVETAEIAIQAALTGHLVLSTIHTNDSAGAFSRLIDMGVEPFLVSSSLSLALAQRLVRRLCPLCREKYRPSPSEALKIGLTMDRVDAHGGFIYRPHQEGCSECSHLGYSGRTAIYEMLPVTDEIRQLVMNRADASSIRKMAIKMGMSTMREDGADKILQGLTSISEVLRVTQDENDE